LVPKLGFCKIKKYLLDRFFQQRLIKKNYNRVQVVQKAKKMVKLFKEQYSALGFSFQEPVFTSPQNFKVSFCFSSFNNNDLIEVMKIVKSFFPHYSIVGCADINNVNCFNIDFYQSLKLILLLI